MPVQKSSYHLTLCSCKNAYCFPGHYGLFIWWYILTMILLTFQLPYLSVKYAQNFHFFTLFKFFCLVFLFLKNTNNSIIDKHLIFKAKLPNFRTIRLMVTWSFVLHYPTIFIQTEMERLKILSPFLSLSIH